MKKLKLSKTTKRAIIFLFACVVLFGLLAAFMLYTFVRPTNNRDNGDRHKQQVMLKEILRCGELAPIPKGARIRTIETEGNMFTRSFRLIFEADTDVIKNWLQTSKGVQTAKSVEVGSIKKCILHVKCDYEYAEILVDYRNHQVTVYVSKS